MLNPKIYENMKAIPGIIPTCLHYGELLQIAYTYIRHDMEQCRNLYGKYTYGQWYALLRKYKVNMTRFPFRILVFSTATAKKPLIQEFFKDKKDMMAYAKQVREDHNASRIELYKSVAGVWKRQ